MIIEIEGSDGAGKNTQSLLLLKKLTEKGHNVKLLSFPTYKNTDLLKRYLAGEFGDIDTVDPYLASTFYAIDRKIEFDKKEVKDFLKDEKNILICDRYVFSNHIHQTPRIAKFDKENKNAKLFLAAFIEDLEFNCYELPQPNIIFYLFNEKARELREIRANGSTLDLHERNNEYMNDCERCGLVLAEDYNWNIIRCVDNINGDYLKSKEEINAEIMSILEKTKCI